VIDRPFSETSARREAGMPGPDDDRGDLFDDSAPLRLSTADQATSTVTLVGLVMTSNTADRFWDWATIASMSARDASASIS
jgi:hypothetical protein